MKTDKRTVHDPELKKGPVTTGFTLGKFAPLHRGHQLMIETAIEENDEVIVLIYDSPEVTDVPLPVRAGWIRKLYPGVEVIEAWDGPAESGYTPEIQKMHEEHILALLGGRKITRFYSSERYGEHVSAALGAQNRQVDPGRLKVPVSGTRVRHDPYGRRGYVDPVVYRDLITKVVFLGAPSTGKTTLASYLADLHGTSWMPEYGREYWAEHQTGRRLSKEQLLEIAEGHVQREERLTEEADKFVFVDTDARTTLRFSMYYHGEALPRLHELAEAAAARYDLVFVCDTDIPYDDTWDRSGDAQRNLFQKQILADLNVRRIPYFVLRGTLEERAARVNAVLARYRKYRSLAEMLV
ncbi:AAA family ATPase [Paenibacillus sp. UNC499MF]|uniref:AAA family ATPase n=1 Tax=Paenibacillus sp. UNC499MF TaxID=1502751 RepID=UPI000CDEE146|nr:AAA family ATPase [Paenibacillus sp. UNC499MF]